MDIFLLSSRILRRQREREKEENRFRVILINEKIPGGRERRKKATHMNLVFNTSTPLLEPTVVSTRKHHRLEIDRFFSSQTENDAIIIDFHCFLSIDYSTNG